MSTLSAADGRGERWAVHRAERRAHILDAAIAVIEREPLGSEVHIRQIAAEAGLGRAVVYRHFTDRADLDRAVRDRILEQLTERLIPEFTLSGTIEQLIFRIVHAYVDWATAHPALHRLAAVDTPDEEGGGGLGRATEQLGGAITMLVTSGAALLQIPISASDRALIDPLGAGIIGQVFGTVRSWLGQGGEVPSAELIAGMLARSIWFQIDGLAKDRGAVLDRNASLDELLAAGLHIES